MKKYHLCLTVAFLMGILSGKAQEKPENSLYQHPQLPKHLQNYEAFMPDAQIQNKLQENWDVNGVLRIGYLPVTLFGARPWKSASVNAEAIENAIRFARDWNYVVYIPAGTYKISRTISVGLQSFESATSGKYRNQRWSSIQIVGGHEGNKRAILKLESSDSGFKIDKNSVTHETAKPLLQLYAEAVSEANILCEINKCNLDSDRKQIDNESSASNFNMVIRDVMIDVSGYSSAIGVRFAGAQGCSMENCYIKATGAYAGFSGGLGSGGGYFNCTVEGGQYGFISIDPRRSQEILMTGMRFIDQTNAVFSGPTYKGHAIVGLYVKKTGARIFDPTEYTYITLEKDKDDDNKKVKKENFAGFVDQKGISIVDAFIDISGPDDLSDAVFWTHRSNNIYLENVHIKGAVTNIVRRTNGSKKVFLENPSPNGTYSIKEFAHQKANSNRFVIWNSIADPKKSASDFPDPVVNSIPPVTAGWLVVDKHIKPIREFKLPFKEGLSIWDLNTKAYPTLLADDVFMIDPELGIDKTSDRQYVQNVLNNIHNQSQQPEFAGKKRVFVPRGVYYMDNTLQLRGQSKLFGMSKTNSVIRALPKMHELGYTVPLVKTDLSSGGSAILADLFLQDRLEDYDTTNSSQYNNDLAFLLWQHGEESVVADVVFGDYNTWKIDTSYLTVRANKYFVKVANGGGKWYGVHGINTQIRDLTVQDNFRAFVADNANNLNIYSMNYERFGKTSPASAQAEIRNSNKVTIFLFKTETKGGKGSDVTSTPLRIRNSNGIAIHTASGRIEDLQITNSFIGGLIDIKNSTDITITSARAFNLNGPQYTIKVDGFPTGVPDASDESVVFYSDKSTGIDNGFVSAFWHLPEVPNKKVVEEKTVKEEDPVSFVYPNPANTTLTVDLNGQDIDLVFRTVPVQIVDLMGNVRYNTTIQQIGASKFAIDVSSYTPGVYTLIIGTQDNQITSKFVVE